MTPGKVGPGFGIGALEELDAEDEDIYASGQFSYSYFLLFYFLNDFRALSD